jgi:hypothetical protein
MGSGLSQQLLNNLFVPKAVAANRRADGRSISVESKIVAAIAANDIPRALRETVKGRNDP